MSILAAIVIIVSPLSYAAKNLWIEKPTVQEEIKQEWEKWNKYQLSSILSVNPNFLPIRDWNITEPEIEAEAAIVFESNRNKVLYQKNVNTVLPIASLTKITTALVVLDLLNPEITTIVSKKAVNAYGTQGKLTAEEVISVKHLLYAMLMESSNDAAAALAETVEQRTGLDFIELMNQKAKAMGLTETVFVDPSGYDSGNVSTAKEVSQILIYSFKQPLIWKILRTPAIDLTVEDGTIHHWTNTDQLLGHIPNIIGGKTGYTAEAQGCLALAVECSDKQGYLITVVLGSQERFTQTEKLINWAKEAYLWN